VAERQVRRDRQRGIQRRGDFTAADWLASSAWKRSQATTYASQAETDEKIAQAMERFQADTTDMLPVEALFQLVREYGVAS
jgi:hypothetical protein